MPRCRFLFILSLSVFLLGVVVQPSYSQKNDLEKAKLLYEQAEKLYQQGYYAKAIPIAEKTLAIREKVLGPEHPDVAQSLNGLGRLHLKLGNYDKVKPLYQRAKAIYERAYGPEHPNVAKSLNGLAEFYGFFLGDLKKAEFLSKKALTITKKAYGPDHLDVAETSLYLGVFYLLTTDFDKSKHLLEQSLSIRKKILGHDHKDVGEILNHLGLLYYKLGNYEKAEFLYKRALEIYEKGLRPEHPNVAGVLNNLGFLYSSLGDYDQSESLYRRSLTISKKAFGKESIHVGNTINYLGALYYNLGEYPKAMAFFKRTLEIMEKALGSDHPNVAIYINNLSVVYYSLGEYAKAVAFYKRSLDILEKVFGPKHFYLVTILNNLGELYRVLGNYDKAALLFIRSLEISEKALGPDHPDVATCLKSLGNVYNGLGDNAKAEILYKKALAINEKVFGSDHPQVASCLNNLGLIYNNIGDFDKAESYYKKSIAISEKVFGPEHPQVAISLNNLGEFYRVLGNYDKAALLFIRSLEIFEKALGPDHPNVVMCLARLALLYAALDNFEKARELGKRALELESKLIDQVMGFTSESQRMEFLSKNVWNLYGFLSLTIQHLSQNPPARRDAFNAWLKRKGVVLDAQKRFQEALIYSDDSEAIKTFQKLSRVRVQISRLTFADPGKQDLNMYKKKIADLETQKQELEAKLSRLSQAFALNKKIAKADCEKVARSLPQNTVLIDFARVKMFNLKAKRKEKKWLPAHYLAFVLHAGKGDNVGMIDLGDAKKIDNIVAEYKKEISNIRDIKDGKPIKSSGKIYDLVFQPLKKELGDIKEIFISPDGNLNLIPFEVLQGPDGRYLIEDYTFNYLAAGRDLLGFGQIKGKGDTALLMGDPDFDMGADEKNSTLRKLALAKVDHEDLERRSSDMKGLHFRRLPGARQEVKAIQDILGEDKSELFTGKQALEEVLRQSGTPSILHLATHGFFLKDQELDNIPSDPTARGFDSFSMLIKRKEIKVKIENPMLRSGFALAGANRSLQVMDEQTDDGIVTSEEILGLRLRGTDMVVLSACDTGLGDVSTGEGVFGLRRAFAQAGAKSLVMSMWSVPDKETRELMVEFYKNIKSGKMNRCQALRQAALKEMKIVKERYGHAYPICWGGFVMVGDPGQLN